MPMTAFPDETLADLTRTGDERAYAELWRRHSAAGRAAATRFAQIADPDDLVQEAFLLVYSAMADGKGPTGAFRPYLYRTIRNVAVSLSRRRNAQAVGDEQDLALLPGAPVVDDQVDQALEKTITARAFGRLPERWQTVLWYTAVEGMPPRDVAPIVGLSSNATAALALRAREGLRVEWLRAHLEHPGVEPECRRTVERLPELERDGLGPSERADVTAHLRGCLRCSIVQDELGEVASKLRLILLPLVLAAPGLAVPGLAVTGLAAPGLPGGGTPAGVPSPRPAHADETPGGSASADVGPDAGSIGAAGPGAGAAGPGALGLPASLGLAAAVAAVLALSLSQVVLPEPEKRATSIAGSAAPERTGAPPPDDLSSDLAVPDPAVPDDALPGAAGTPEAPGRDAHAVADADTGMSTDPSTGPPADAAAGPGADADRGTSSVLATAPDDAPAAGAIVGPGPAAGATVPEASADVLDAPVWSELPAGPLWWMPTLTGSGQPGARVELRAARSAELVAAASVDDAGRWAAAVSGVAAGELLLEARQLLGTATSTSVVAPRALDLRAPALLDPAPGSVVAAAGGQGGALQTLAVTFTGAAGLSVEVFFDGAATGTIHTLGSLPLTRTRPGVTAGAHAVALRYVDPATGRTGATATSVFTVGPPRGDAGQ